MGKSISPDTGAISRCGLNVWFSDMIACTMADAPRNSSV
jgi:hypothetical protein